MPSDATPAAQPFPRRAVRVGLWTMAATLSLVLAYPFLPGHGPVVLGPYLALVAAGAALAVLLVVLRTQLITGALGHGILYAWLLADIGLVSAAVAISGGDASPLFLCYALTSLFVTSCYPLRAQAAILAVTLGAYLATLAAGGPLNVADLVLRSAAIVLVTALGASLANEKDRNAAESARRAALLATVARVAREVSGAESGEVLRAVLEATAELGFESAHISILDEASGSYEVVRARGVPKEVLVRGLSPATGMLGMVLGERATVWLEDYAGHQKAVAEFVAAGITTAVGTPLWVDGSLVGVFAVGSSRHRWISSEDREAFELLASVASRGFEGARRFEQLAATEARTRHMAQHDELTGLANRSLLYASIDDALDDALGDALGGLPGYRWVTLIVFDLDDFKRVNDTLGHAAGDELLAGVAARISGCMREGDTLARLSGDEFGILARDLDGEAADGLARRVLEALGRPFRVEHRQMAVRASLGVASTRVAPATAEERLVVADRLLSEADVAMYEAKRAGKGCHVNFDHTMRDRMLQRMAVEAELLQALDAGEMTVVYQPIFDLASEAVTGFEALVRWESPRLGTVSPVEFVPIAEESGAIIPLGRFVLRRACEDLQVLRRASAACADLVMSVNLSTRQLRDPCLVEDVLRILAETWMPSRCLTLEITESALLEDAAGGEERLCALAALGVTMALDDFGTGYSSLAYLQRLKVHSLKIDRTFVDGLGSSREASALVKGIVNLADALALTTVAEGLETTQQLEELRQLGCRRGQGYLLARPLPPDQLLDLVGSRGVLGSPRTEPDLALEGEGDRPATRDVGPALRPPGARLGGARR